MKIVYLPSGYPGIYQFFDQCILHELTKFPNVHIRNYPLLDNTAKLQAISDEFNPDILITLLGDHLPNSTLNWIHHQPFQSVLWLTEDPYYTDRSIKVLPYFDFVFSIDSGAVDYYKRLGYENVDHLPLGTDPKVFSPKNNMKKSIDICLVGYPYPDRIRLVSLILKETPFRLQLVGNDWRNPLFLGKSSSKLNLVNGWIPPSRVAHYYSSAKIVLNTYRPYNHRSNQNSARIKNRSVNNRTFDIAACGSFQLTQFIDDLPRHFEEPGEIISFQSDEEFIDKLTFYLSNDEERKTIATNASERVLKEHTFTHRIHKIMDIVKGHLN